jgi:hypothetical protein
MSYLTTHIRFCPTHDAHLRSYFADDFALAVGHVWRLWIERGLPWYRLTLNCDDLYDEGHALNWLYRNCWTVAQGCPVCHDPKPDELLDRAHRAVDETRLGLYPHWRLGSRLAMRVADRDGRDTAYLAPLVATETQVRRPDTIEASWN